MSAGSRAGGDRRVLDEAGGLRAMTGVMGIMLFLTVLAAAVGIGMQGTATALERQLAGRLTVQIVEGDPAARDADAARVLTILRAMPAVARAVPVDHAQLIGLLRPWLGNDGADPELPVPAMIDVDLISERDAAHVAAEARRVGAAVRVDAHESWMSPVSGVITTMTWLALALVLLMLAATSAVVTLAARAGLETHRATIEVMHMLGATDVQVARLFQRRIALDATIGGLVGAVAAMIVIAFVGWRLQGLGSDLLGGISLGAGGWAILASLPVFFVAMATIAARVTVVAALRRTL